MFWYCTRELFQSCHLQGACLQVYRSTTNSTFKVVSRALLLYTQFTNSKVTPAN